MIYFKHNRTHRKNGKKDLVHIVKVSDDTFAQSEIIPIFGIMLCVLSLISSFQNYCGLCDKKYFNNNSLFPVSLSAFYFVSIFSLLKTKV